MDLINLTTCMMPIFMYLEPKRRDREDIAAISAYLWVIVISVESAFHISSQVFSVSRGVFSCPYFLMLLIFFRGTLLKKGSLYISTWLFVVLSTSLNESASWILKGHVSLAYGQIRVAVSLPWACGFYVSVRFWLRDRVNRLFDQLSRRPCSPLLTYPSVSPFILFVGNNIISSSRSLAVRGLEDVLFYLVLCVMILVLYAPVLSSILEVMRRRRTEEKLQLARQLISQQREYYNQALDYTEQVRIIRHNSCYHIHTLLDMDRGERTHYLVDLKGELDMTTKMVFCQDWAVNGLLQGYVARAGQDGVKFTARADLPAHVPVDDLTLRIVIGNLLESAMEACHHLTGHWFILVRVRWLDGHLMMLVENSYDEQVKKNRSRALSSKRNGGLGTLSIKRILDQPGDEFDMDYNDITFTAMVKIVDRALGQADDREILEQFWRGSC